LNTVHVSICNSILVGVLNDLDLTVHGNEKAFYPNGLTGPDRLNNAERVIIDKPTNGARYSIRVFGSNLLDVQVMQRMEELFAYQVYSVLFFAHIRFFLLGLLARCDWLPKTRGSRWWWWYWQWWG
jgi:hypothetical protein